MPSRKKTPPKEKDRLHQRNRHRVHYDFEKLCTTHSALSTFVQHNGHDDYAIDFSDSKAVKALNKALLLHFYGIDYWDIPKHYLCPPVPGRADYIHYMADLLSEDRPKTATSRFFGSQITCLDIGTGANLIYPIIGQKEYGWSFIGTDIDPAAIASAKKIVYRNPTLNGKVEIRHQTNVNSIFEGILHKKEFVDLTICNPPFHASAKEARKGTLRKLSNLKKRKITRTQLNFEGRGNELWCKGGELRFIGKMIEQSKNFATSVLWFSSLVSKSSHLTSIYRHLRQEGAVETKTIPMGQGNKTSRVVAWTFLDSSKREQWRDIRWHPK